MPPRPCRFWSPVGSCCAFLYSPYAPPQHTRSLPLSLRPPPQRPAALHICITAAHSSGIIDLLLRDLQEAVATALQVGELSTV